MFNYSSCSDKIRKIKEGELSLRDNVEAFLQNTQSKAHLNAFNNVFGEDALIRADAVEAKIRKGSCGQLAGYVIAVKDLLSIKDKPHTCSSRILSNFKAVYTATAVQRLLDNDAIIIGTTNCDEFGMGSTNENSAFGSVLNPVNEKYVPGGSSGGSAAAAAAFLCDAAIGTDTGGSIRQPAAFCGIYGFKPLYGRISRYGLTAYASSFDTIGPIARNIADIKLLLKVMSGKDIYDSTSLPDEEDFPTTVSPYKGRIRIGVPKEYLPEGLNAEIKNKLEETITSFGNKGYEIVNISLPHSSYATAAYYILAMAEASSNLARFDGVRYGYRSNSGNSLKEVYINSRSEGFGEEVKRRIMLGTYVLSSGYYDAYYEKAQRVRRLIKEDFDKAFTKVDVILAPASPSTAYPLGELQTDPLQMYLDDLYTTPVNLAGIAALSFPAGNSKSGLPIGLQLISDHESKILGLF